MIVQRKYFVKYGISLRCFAEFLSLKVTSELCLSIYFRFNFYHDDFLKPCKDNANRIQNQIYLNYVEVPLILSKDNANRIRSQIYLNNIEMPLILFKDINFSPKYINSVYVYSRCLRNFSEIITPLSIRAKPATPIMVILSPRYPADIRSVVIGVKYR